MILLLWTFVIPNAKDSHLIKDHINISNKNEIDNLPWLLKIEFNRDKLLTKEITLLDIKVKIYELFEKKYTGSKDSKKEDKAIMDKITQLKVYMNSDNDDVPMIHIKIRLN